MVASVYALQIFEKFYLLLYCGLDLELVCETFL